MCLQFYEVLVQQYKYISDRLLLNILRINDNDQFLKEGLEYSWFCLSAPLCRTWCEPAETNRPVPASHSRTFLPFSSLPDNLQNLCPDPPHFKMSFSATRLSQENADQRSARCKALMIFRESSWRKGCLHPISRATLRGDLACSDWLMCILWQAADSWDETIQSVFLSGLWFLLIMAK